MSWNEMVQYSTHVLTSSTRIKTALSNRSYGKDGACDAIAEQSGRGWLVSREGAAYSSIIEISAELYEHKSRDVKGRRNGVC
jgi:hypothetical protein